MLYKTIITLLFAIPGVNAIAQDACTQTKETACTEENSLRIAKLYCAIALQGCEKVSNQLNSTVDKVSWRSACSVHLSSLKGRLDEPSKILATYAYSEAEAMFDGVRDVAKEMRQSDNIGTKVYGGILALMYGGVGPAIRAGKNPESCVPAYQQACLAASQRIRFLCNPE